MIVGMLLSALGVNNVPIAHAEEGWTETPTPTDTESPTETPTETLTPIPSETVTTTSTATFTETPTSTSTSTLTPTLTTTPTLIPGEIPTYEEGSAVYQPGSELLHALQSGEYPAQLAAVMGIFYPNRYGPQRNDPDEGIPEHAYSPFDEKNNREYPCPPGGCEYVAGQVLVKLTLGLQVNELAAQGAWTADGETNQALAAQSVLKLEPVFPNAISPELGAQVIAPDGSAIPMPDLTLWYRATFPEDVNVLGVVEELEQAEGIDIAQPDYLRKPVGSLDGSGAFSADPAEPQPAPLNTLSDPLYPQQWHLGAANVPQAWNYLEGLGLPPGGSRDIIVAVIDTGVDYTHPDLAANMWVNPAEFNGVPGVDDDHNGYVDDIHGADMITNSGNQMDDHGHGSHVAGIIGAQADNGIGGVGVAYNVQVMALKAAQYSGVLSSSDIAEAIYYAVQKGADVINMSFGGYARSQVEEDALAVAFGQAVLVAAAGNDAKVNLPCPFGRDMYPAAYNWVLGVMASTPAGGRASFSNFDCTPHDTHEYELLAPGVDVWSTLPVNQYAAWDGTSMAAPIVSGIAALLRTKWTDKDVYSSRFIMGQIAANASPGANAYAALTVAPKPELRYLEHWLFDTTAQASGNDDDGIVDAGETIELAIVIRNHWGKADPVSVKLEAWAEGAYQADPYVTMLIDTVDYGAIGSFNWDDNGLIYDEQGVITGVRYPFRFSVDANTPNDHVIPFRLTMTARNGLDPTDTTVYTFVSRFSLIVQRGRELPDVISEDMVLSEDYFWIVPGPVLIESAVTVTVTEGTQIQWGSENPSDPYSTPSSPYLQVEGALFIQGTDERPVELFPSELFRDPAHPALTQANVRIYNFGETRLVYAKVRNPELGYGDGRYPITSVDHSYFDGDGDNSANLGVGGGGLVFVASSVTESVFHKLNGVFRAFRSGWENAIFVDTIDGSLFDASKSVSYVGAQPGDNCDGVYGCRRITIVPRGTIHNSVFIQENTSNLAAMKLRFDSVSGQHIFGTPEEAAQSTFIAGNAFLSKLWDPNPWHWMQIQANVARNNYVGLVSNFWGTTSTIIIDAAIDDYHDDFNKAHVVYQPILTAPITTTYPFVWDVVLSTAGNPDITIVGAEPVTFTVKFNRDMDNTVQPAVSFGPDVPETDYTIHPVEGGWQDPRTWAGTFNITPVTGDGYQLIRVAGAVAADDPWLVTGDDAGRYRFEIITSGTEAMNLQATGGEGYVDLSWTQDDFDLLAGYNLYRATSQDGTYTRLNQALIPSDLKTYRDTNVQPGQPYYYKFTIVKTDMSESDFSNVATATPVDTVPPVITHTPITSAPPGMPLSISTTVTDNVSVQSVTLFFRKIGTTSYESRAMTLTTGNLYSATIEGSKVASPGVEYYIQASDGISTVNSGRPEYPHQVTVVDRPVVTSVTPNHGPSSGGTQVTIVGSNFKTGASVTFGGAVCGSVTVISASQITCTTPAHFPETVDVVVTNADSQSGTLLRGFTYESETASLFLPLIMRWTYQP